MSFFKKRINNSQSKLAGFTLVEIIIVMAIVGMFLMIGVNSNYLKRNQFVLTASQEQLRALVSRAKFLTVNSLFVAQDKICAYGVRIEAENGRAVIFEAHPHFDNCPLAGVIKQNTFQKDLSGPFNVLHLEKGAQFNRSFEIYFLPPDPLTVLYENGSSKNEIIIELFIQDIANRRRILINNAGLIDLIRS